ncbi:MAG: nucleobase:cation symporter-2 family protein [Fusobacteriaceae bacterium]
MALRLRVDEKPANPGVWVLLSLQHIFAAFSGIVTVPFLFGSILGFSPVEMGELIANMLVVSGVVTIIQAKGIGPFGSRLPQIMGSNFTFIGPGLAIGTAAAAAGGGPSAGYAAILGSSMVGSFVQIFLGSFTAKIRKFFPPVVQGVVVSLIGLTILGVAVDWFAGGVGSPDYASLSNISLGLIVMVITILLNHFGKGIISSGAIFFGIIIGYIIAAFMGKLDLSPISQAGAFYLPRPFKYGMTFKWEYIIPFAIAYLVALVEATGDTLAIAKVTETDMKDGKRLRGALLWGGIGSFLGSIFNGTPTTTFSQNTGVVSITGIASRFVVIGSGIILVIMGLIPKIGAIVAVMPNPVLGGAGIVMFGTIAAVGIGIFKDVKYTNSNILIIGVAISSGLAVTMKPDVLKALPEALRTILSSGITTGTIVAIVMNVILNYGVKHEDELEEMISTENIPKKSK